MANNVPQGPGPAIPLAEWRVGEPLAAEKMNGSVRAINRLNGFTGAQQVTPYSRGEAAAIPSAYITVFTAQVFG